MRKYRINSKAGNSQQKETCRTVSLTVPDQTLTVRELLQRSALGQYDDQELEYDYNMDEEDLRSLDPSEMFYMAQESSAIVKDANAKKQKADKEKADKAYRQQIIDEHEKSKTDVTS